jgi:Ca-activated chloride channel homolog
MRPATRLCLLSLVSSTVLLALGLVWASGARAQQQSTPPAPPAQKSEEYRIRRDVNLVVLHATVLDDRGRFVPDLRQESFRVFEDKVEQKLAIFKREDVPVSVGLVIDNSGSMRDKRVRVNTAALTFVKTSNPDDEVFVVNFNDDFYLDTDKDFTNNINELKEALERIDSRGSTAFYDAVIGSLDHLKKGSKDKKVLLVITDGEDNASRKNLAQTVQEAQKSDALIYTVGLLSQESKRSAKRARQALNELSTATGGLAFFPEDARDTEAICTQIAHDIRNQYTLAYYPTNTAKDGSFRSVHVDVTPPHGHGRVTVRTRTGYYAQRASAGN